jgi:hypothetical protein
MQAFCFVIHTADLIENNSRCYESYLLLLPEYAAADSRAQGLR